MSRPFRPTQEILNSEDWDRLEEAGPNGIYLDGIVICQGENCMAWVPEKKELIQLDSDCPGADENPFIEKTTGGYCEHYPHRKNDSSRVVV